MNMKSHTSKRTEWIVTILQAATLFALVILVAAVPASDRGSSLNGAGVKRTSYSNTDMPKIEGAKLFRPWAKLPMDAVAR